MPHLLSLLVKPKLNLGNPGILLMIYFRSLTGLPIKIIKIQKHMAYHQFFILSLGLTVLVTLLVWGRYRLFKTLIVELQKQG